MFWFVPYSVALKWYFGCYESPKSDMFQTDGMAPNPRVRQPPFSEFPRGRGAMRCDGRTHALTGACCRSAKPPSVTTGSCAAQKQFPKARGRSHGFGTESFGCCVAVAAGCAA